MKCPKCPKETNNPEEIEFIEENGMCLSCDHILGEEDNQE